MAIDVKGTLYWETGLPAHQSGRVEGAVLKYADVTTTDPVLAYDDRRFRQPPFEGHYSLPVEHEPMGPVGYRAGAR